MTATRCRWENEVLVIGDTYFGALGYNKSCCKRRGRTEIMILCPRVNCSVGIAINIGVTQACSPYGYHYHLSYEVRSVACLTLANIKVFCDVNTNTVCSKCNSPKERDC